ncbi:hypothetical protein RlegWSM1455_09355 [Rhizobium laguerreae]|uniref:hypothetical protein n=1 Tax=Rhizobium laguerreae TaxID=1076926 RepID=UPI001E439FCE|nr:hypothetical protein [Rhizobium laguerreae]UFW66189.1 hypothetical protein RlegWSM1455_09355 [Rhizobium laguerreae]
MTLGLDAETISRLIQHIEPDLTVSGFSRLEGGSTEVYKIDVANSDYGSLVLKIYPDKPEWGPSKETLVAGWLKELRLPVPTWLRVDESRSLLPLRLICPAARFVTGWRSLISKAPIARWGSF